MLLGILLAIIIVICIALVGVILLQRSEGGALGMSGGGPGNFMTARGAGDLLTRTTQILAALFFILCLAMTLISGHSRSQASVAERLKLQIDPTVLAARQKALNAAAPAPIPASGAGPVPVGPAPTHRPTSPSDLLGSLPDQTTNSSGH
jgi:preprotein translocase subunit SecG